MLNPRIPRRLEPCKPTIATAPGPNLELGARAANLELTWLQQSRGRQGAHVTMHSPQGRTGWPQLDAVVFQPLEKETDVPINGRRGVDGRLAANSISVLATLWSTALLTMTIVRSFSNYSSAKILLSPSQCSVNRRHWLQQACQQASLTRVADRPGRTSSARAATTPRPTGAQTPYRPVSKVVPLNSVLEVTQAARQAGSRSLAETGPTL